MAEVWVVFSFPGDAALYVGQHSSHWMASAGGIFLYARGSFGGLSGSPNVHFNLFQNDIEIANFILNTTTEKNALNVSFASGDVFYVVVESTADTFGGTGYDLTISLGG